MGMSDGFIARCDLCHDIVATHENESRCHMEWAKKTKQITIWGQSGGCDAKIIGRVCKECVETGRIHDHNTGNKVAWTANF